jgi:hypothetical protein
MKCIKASLLAVSLLLVVPAYAHEGHDSPGALPAPPNGGKVAEASHSAAHEGGAEERELFAEAKLQGSLLRIYALGLDAKNTKVWMPLPPSAALTLTDVKVEMPRAKKTNAVSVHATAGGWEGDIGAIKDRRIVVVATFLDGKEKKQAKIQLEK